MFVTDETKAAAQGVLDYLESQPEKHNQESYFRLPANVKPETLTEENFCGTTMCIAGTALYLDQGIEGIVNFYDGLDADEYSGQKLGLDAVEANTLFYTFDNATALDALRAIAAGDEVKFHALIGL